MIVTRRFNKNIAPLLPIVIMAAIVLSVFSLMTTSVSAADLVWDISTVDSDGNTGEASSLAIDAAGNPHISYFESSPNRELKYAWYDSGWHTSTVDATYAFRSSLALDAADYPHISYMIWDGTKSILSYTYQDADGWHPTTLPESSGVQAMSLKLDGTGNPHIAYNIYDSATQSTSLKYTVEDSEGWHTTTVESGTGSQVSLALDASGNPRISYCGGPNGNTNLKYAWYDGTWHTTTVDGRWFTGQSNSLALDAAGNPHIAYSENNMNRNYYLDYAWYDGTWHTTTADWSGMVGSQCSLALDASGNPHISYAEYGSPEKMKYAWYDTSWHTNTIGAGQYVALALDSVGIPHISYQYVADQELRYATLHNNPPTANAGPDQIVKAKSTVQLDGSKSSDPDGDSLTYTWTLLEKPDKSKAQLSDVTAMNPTFTPDKAETYKIQLVVTDEHGMQSATDEVIVTAVNKMPK